MSEFNPFSQPVLEVVFVRGHGIQGVEYFANEAEYEAWLVTGFRAVDVNFDVLVVRSVLPTFAASLDGAIAAARRASRLVVPA